MTVVCNIEKDMLNMTRTNDPHEENTTLCKLMKTNLYVKAIQAWIIYNIMVINETIFTNSLKTFNTRNRIFPPNIVLDF